MFVGPGVNEADRSYSRLSVLQRGKVFCGHMVTRGQENAGGDLRGKGDCNLIKTNRQSCEEFNKPFPTFMLKSNECFEKNTRSAFSCIPSDGNNLRLLGTAKRRVPAR